MLRVLDPVESVLWNRAACPKIVWHFRYSICRTLQRNLPRQYRLLLDRAKNLLEQQMPVSELQARMFPRCVSWGPAKEDVKLRGCEQECLHN